MHRNKVKRSVSYRGCLCPVIGTVILTTIALNNLLYTDAIAQAKNYQKEIADTLKVQLEIQNKIVNLLENNLAVMERMNTIFKEKEFLVTSSDSVVDAELEELRSKLKDL
jgi:exonuclease I